MRRLLDKKKIFIIVILIVILIILPISFWRAFNNFNDQIYAQKQKIEDTLSPTSLEGIFFRFVEGEDSELASNVVLDSFYVDIGEPYNTDIYINAKVTKTHENDSRVLFFEYSSFEEYFLEYKKIDVTCDSKDELDKEWRSEPKYFSDEKEIPRIRTELYMEQFEVGTHSIHIYLSLPPPKAIYKNKRFIDFEVMAGAYLFNNTFLQIILPNEYSIYSYTFSESKIGPKATGNILTERIYLENEYEHIRVMASRPTDIDILDFNYKTLKITMFLGMISIYAAIIALISTFWPKFKDNKPIEIANKMENN